MSYLVGVLLSLYYVEITLNSLGSSMRVGSVVLAGEEHLLLLVLESDGLLASQLHHHLVDGYYDYD